MLNVSSSGDVSKVRMKEPAYGRCWPVSHPPWPAVTSHSRLASRSSVRRSSVSGRGCVRGRVRSGTVHAELRRAQLHEQPAPRGVAETRVVEPDPTQPLSDAGERHRSGRQNFIFNGVLIANFEVKQRDVRCFTVLCSRCLLHWFA
eukprot:GHVU01069634.1.p2 GENE.GHVU01069634.1~~GHVU01069634.1.p2  ORF type:complete len:146 (+),score=5.93 GHVU01069634.1:546-983(+)